MSFDTLGLNEALLAQVSRQGYTQPTPIQAAAIPVVLTGRDVIGLAQTGTGKTAAFVLPIIQRLMAGKKGGIRALVITPTRELAEQVHAVFAALSQGTGLRSATVYGGVSMIPQEQALRTGADIIVACPGRLLDHIARGYVRLNNLQTLVLDEADRMFDMGFLPDIKRILSHLPARRQTLLFSATMAPEIKELALSATQNAKTVQVDLSMPATTVAHGIYPINEHSKTALLLELLRRTPTESVLVFTRTKHRANRVAMQLEREQYKVARLHSNRSQNQRQIALDGFRDGTFQVLVATDIAARGIDVATVSHVINYDIPDTADAYIHRIGRTGRAARTGDAFTLVTPEDSPMVRTIERTIGHALERRTVNGFVEQPAPSRQQQQSDRRSQRSSSDLRQSGSTRQSGPSQRQQAGSSQRQQPLTSQRQQPSSSSRASDSIEQRSSRPRYDDRRPRSADSERRSAEPARTSQRYDDRRSRSSASERRTGETGYTSLGNTRRKDAA